MPSYQKGHKRATTSIQISQMDEEEWVIRLRSSSTETFRDLIEELKAIPYNQRSYDPQAKTWKVYDRAHLDEWLETARGFGAEVKWVDADTFRQPTRPERMSSSEAFKGLHLTPSAPPEVIKACHKALALIHHPDRGGDVEKMKVINMAHDFLVKGGHHDNIS